MQSRQDLAVSEVNSRRDRCKLTSLIMAMSEMLTMRAPYETSKDQSQVAHASESIEDLPGKCAFLNQIDDREKDLEPELQQDQARTQSDPEQRMNSAQIR